MNRATNPSWVFETANPMGGARATAYHHTLEGADLSVAARLAREAIQNSVDATLDGQRTDVLVWDKPLSPEEASKVRRLLALSSQHPPINRLKKLGIRHGNLFERMRRDDAGETRVTIVEDRKTCGLGFDSGDGKDRFRELCLFLGQESTTVDGSRGGSYGFGKTVYQSASDCSTFLVYSVFEPTSETGDHHARLFGCSSFDGHDIGDEKYTGRAWFGIPESEATGQTTCGPIVDEAAHDLVQRWDS